MFTKEEVKSLEHVFTLARQQAATAHGNNFQLMEGLINVQKNILNKVMSMVPVEDAKVDMNKLEDTKAEMQFDAKDFEEGTEEQTKPVDAEKVEEQPAMHNVD